MLPNYFYIKIKPNIRKKKLSRFSQKLYFRFQKYFGLRLYVGPKHSNFLVHVFGEIWLCSSVITNYSYTSHNL